MAPPYTLLQDADPMDHDFLVVSINSTGAPGNLNRAVMKRAGYPEDVLPGENELRSGYHLIRRGLLKPVLFIVVEPEGAVAEQLHHNLYRGLLTYLADLAGRRVWLPLLGTGAGRLAYAESLALTARVIESLAGETRSEPPQFIISVPGTEEGLALLKEHGQYSEGPSNGDSQPPPPGQNRWVVILHGRWGIEALQSNKPIPFGLGPKDQRLPENDAPIHLPALGERVLVSADDGDTCILREMVSDVINISTPPPLACFTPTQSPVKRVPTYKLEPLLSAVKERLGPLYAAGETIEVFGLIAPLTAEEYEAMLNLGEPPFVNSLLPFYLTEGAHRETQDQLDFEADIDAFAAVIKQADVKPPLAIGLFGNWGSGKSFFMEKLEERIAHPTDWNYPEYVQHVVPVRFNSWHYSDANLWASMIMHIFESLNAYASKTATPQEAIQGIYAELNVTKTQIAETQKALDEKAQEADALEVQKASVERLLAEKRATLGLWSVGEIGAIVFADPFVQEDIRTLEAQFDTKALGENLGALKKQLREAESAGAQIRQAWQDARTHSRGGWLWVWLVVVAVGLLCSVAYFFFKDAIQGVLDDLTIPAVMLVSGLSGLAAKLSPHLKKARNFYRSLKGLVTRIESKKSKLELQQEEIKKSLQDSIQELAAQKNNLVQQKAQAEAKKQALEDQLRDIGSGKMLASFLSGKSADDAYLRQLGIVSWIRKDFEQLNRHFEEQNEARKTGKTTNKPQLQIDRIVLYIDDLDRCSEDVVVKVLEAIHLLLAFPLFVVVVGVDPRWLNNALAEKYKTLFGAKSSRDGQGQLTAEAGSPARGAATSYDYLEKIFQIPFALKPMTKSGREKLIRYLTEERKGTKQADAEALEITAVETDEKEKASLQSDAKELSKNRQPAMEELLQADMPPALQTDTSAPRNPKEKLTISPEELAYMQQLSELFAGTPRTVNRYVNIYRIIKAHGGLQVSGPYERDEALPILFLLAIVVGYPEAADEFLTRLHDAGDGQNCSDFMDGCGIEPLRQVAMPLLGDLGPMPIQYLKRNLALVARFSFRTLMRRLA